MQLGAKGTPIPAATVINTIRIHADSLMTRGEKPAFPKQLGVTGRFVKNCTPRSGRGLCKGGSEWSRFPIPRTAIEVPVVVAGRLMYSHFRKALDLRN
jgi:hypothetical protein